jgi:hypothetical protein
VPHMCMRNDDLILSIRLCNLCFDVLFELKGGEANLRYTQTPMLYANADAMQCFANHAPQHKKDRSSVVQEEELHHHPQILPPLACNLSPVVGTGFSALITNKKRSSSGMKP